jgi:hypothetical protein
MAAGGVTRFCNQVGRFSASVSNRVRYTGRAFGSTFVRLFAADGIDPVQADAASAWKPPRDAPLPHGKFPVHEEAPSAATR